METARSNDTNFTTANPSTTVNLILKAERLKKKDLISKSDPVCIVYQLVGRLEGRSLGKPEWREIGRTERIRNTSDPEWARQISVEYYFEERQTFKFVVYDWDTEDLNTPLSNHDFLGEMECDLAEIVSSGTFTHGLGVKGNCGIITITCEEVDNGNRDIITFNANGEKLDKKDGFFGKSDPYLQIYRYQDSGTKVMVHRTEFIKRNLNPTWKPFELSVKTLCGGDLSKSILIECWDNDDATLTNHDFIGNCTIPMEELIKGAPISKPLINHDKMKKNKKYSNSGILHLRTAKDTVPSFLDFIAGGMQLDFSVAVDFTASNKAVFKPDSLHFIANGVPNQYEIAIRAVLEICQHYNNSKVFDAYGFGAKITDNPNEKMMKCFALKEPKHELNNPAVVGVQGVMYAYRNCLNTVKLWGPTCFAPVINQVMKVTASKMNNPGSRYHVLLIITDGAVSDFDLTKKAIIDASGLPMSIIIIGVGEDEFEKMDELDSDNKALSFGGRITERDIVQFVPIKNFTLCNRSHISDQLIAKLAKDVLAEVPGQVTSYMKKHKLKPRPTDNPWPRDYPAMTYDAPFIQGPIMAATPYYEDKNGSYPPPIAPPVGFNIPAASSTHQQYPPQNNLPNSAPYPNNAPYPPQNNHGNGFSANNYPYGAYSYSQSEQPHSVYPYPTYPQPQRNSPSNIASAPPASLEDIQLSFVNMDVGAQRS